MYNSNRKTSVVWEHFTEIGGFQATCNICQATFSFKTSVTNLKKHLNRKHPMISGVSHNPVASISSAAGDASERAEKLAQQVTELEAAMEQLQVKLKETQATLIQCRLEQKEPERRLTSSTQQLNTCTQIDTASATLACSTAENRASEHYVNSQPSTSFVVNPQLQGLSSDQVTVDEPELKRRKMSCVAEMRSLQVLESHDHEDASERAEKLAQQVTELEAAKEAATANATDSARAKELEAELKESQLALIQCRQERDELERGLTSSTQQLDTYKRERDIASAALALSCSTAENHVSEHYVNSQPSTSFVVNPQSQGPSSDQVTVDEPRLLNQQKISLAVELVYKIDELKILFADYKSVALTFSKVFTDSFEMFKTRFLETISSNQFKYFLLKYGRSTQIEQDRNVHELIKYIDYYVAQNLGLPTGHLRVRSMSEIGPICEHRPRINEDSSSKDEIDEGEIIPKVLNIPEQKRILEKLVIPVEQSTQEQSIPEAVWTPGDQFGMSFSPRFFSQGNVVENIPDVEHDLQEQIPISTAQVNGYLDLSYLSVSEDGGISIRSEDVPDEETLCNLMMTPPYASDARP